MHSYGSLFAFLALSLPLSMSGQSRLAPNVHPAIRAAASVAGGSIEVRQGIVHERVAALRDDVLRITVWRGNTAPEDASWAVPAPLRHSSVPVTQSRDKDHVTLRTAVLSVEIDAKTLKITIRDKNGAIVQQDARPIRFDGDSFRICNPRDQRRCG